MALGCTTMAVASVNHEHGSVLLAPQGSVTFGRSSEVDVTVGLQPVADMAVPRMAGRIMDAGDAGVVVQNLGEVLAFDVVVDGEPAYVVRPQTTLGAPAPRWTIRLSGSASTYSISVQVLDRPTPVPPLRAVGGDEPATVLEPELTPRQWQVLQAYTAPILAGGVSPATHAEVADALGWAKATVRIECNAIWSSFLMAGVPMRDFRDKRDAVVDAATRHRLLS